MQNRAHTTVVVTSHNRAKTDAVKAIFPMALGHRVVVINTRASSGVSSTPIGDTEAIRGCRNRVDYVRQDHPNVDFVVGLEGVVEQSCHGVFVYGWALVEDRQSGRQGLGCSAKVMLPFNVGAKIEQCKSLSNLVAHHYGLGLSADIAEVGTNGVVTKGLFTRRDEFESALRCALGFLLNEANFH